MGSKTGWLSTEHDLSVVRGWLQSRSLELASGAIMGRLKVWIWGRCDRVSGTACDRVPRQVMGSQGLTVGEEGSEDC